MTKGFEYWAVYAVSVILFHVSMPHTRNSGWQAMLYGTLMSALVIAFDFWYDRRQDQKRFEMVKQAIKESALEQRSSKLSEAVKSVAGSGESKLGPF